MGKFNDLLKDMSQKYGDPQPAEQPEPAAQNATQPTSSGKLNALVNQMAKKYGVSGSDHSAALWGYDKAIHSAEGQAGWEEYQESRQQIAQAKKEAEENKTWFDKLGEYLGGVQDTSLPIHMTGEITKGIQEQDANLSKPTDDWAEDQKLTFGYLWKIDREKAWSYARSVNTERNQKAEQAKLQQIQNAATSNFGAGVGHTVGAVLTAPLGLADTMGDMIEMNALGHLSEADGEITPYEYAEAAKGGIAQNLNDKGGTLREDIPIVGGKGWGDVYGLGTSIAQSMLSAHTGGAGQALITSFGPAVQSGIESAKSRGATDEQAMSFGLMSGLAEALAEQVPADKLLKISSASTMKELALNILKQGAAEGLEEGITSIATNFADQLAMKDKSEYNLAVLMYMSNGISREAAQKKAWLEMAEGVLFDMLAGFTSGAVSGGIETGVKTALTALGTRATSNPSRSENAPTAAQTADQPRSDVNTAFDEAIARTTNAPADPIAAAVDSFRTGGVVTNKQAQDILNNTKAITQLLDQTGIKLPDTASGRRNAVKQAIAQLAQQSAEPIDTAQNTDYDNKNTTGGTTYAQTGTDIIHSARPLGANNEFAGVQAESRGASFEDIRQQSLYTDENETVRTRLSAALAGELERRGYRHGNADGLHLNSGRGQTFEVLTVDASTFHDIFEVARKYTRNGELVDLHSVGTTEDGIGYEECENYLSADGMSGFSITPDGDLISVFNADASKKGFLRAIAPVVKSKVKTLDCYMSQQQPLHEIYEKVFDMKVASVMDHNMDYDHDGIAANHNNPKVAFMVNSGRTVEPAFFGKDDYDAAKAYRDNLIYQHSNNQSSGAAPTESVGAAPGWFDPNTRLQYEHGTIPEGENPVRPDDLPKRDYVGGKVSHTARTVKGAKATPDSFVDLLNKEVAEGALSYVEITNSATTQKAIDYITQEGWDAARQQWSADVRAGKAGADMVAVGALLLNNAAKAGDRTAWLDILTDYQALGTNTAQGLQALRILKTLKPSDKLYSIRRSIKQMVKDMHLDTDVTIDPELEAEYLNAETDQARDKVLKKIKQDVAAQLPATWMEKWNALRYVNMLGNFRTQVRNIAGNAGMKVASAAKNAVATALEVIAHKASGGKFQRTKSLTVGRDLLKAAKADFDAVQSAVMGNGKYGDSNAQSSEFAQGVQSERRIFKNKALEGYRKITNWAMEQGDLIFSKSAYARALAGYLKANGVSGSDLSSVDSSLMDNARMYAIKEAQEATFRDSNILSDWISKVGRRKDTPTAVKVVSEGIMPFRKTPANVLIRAEEYSPLGIINSVATSIKAMQKDSDVTGAQVINSWAKTLTGTGIFGLGMLLNSLGCLTAGPDEDEDKDAFDSMNGWQNYALTLPDGTNLTIDFLTPSAMPLLMGAELMELIQDGGFELKDLESALTSIAEPMIQMSMLQGVNDTLENVQYVDNNLGQLLINSGLSYLTQGLTNTLAGQIERTFEDSRMTTYVDKDSALPAWLQRAIGKASAKIPGWDYQQIPYINAWGEEEENPEWYVNGAYNLLSPSYIEKGVSTALTQELNRLNEVQSDVNVYPSAPDKTITYSGKDHSLSAEKYVALAKAQGQTQKQVVEALISSADYSALSDAGKAQAIKYAYDYARDTARIEVLDDYPGYSSKWMEGINGNAAEAILRHTAVGTTEKYAYLPISTAAYVADLLKGIQKEAKADGTTYANVRDIQKMEAIVADDSLSKYVDDLLRDILDAGPEAKYDKALDAGYTAEQFVGGYRQYVDTTSEGKKQSVIRYCQREMGMSYAAAKKLYEIYNSKTTDE